MIFSPFKSKRETRPFERQCQCFLVGRLSTTIPSLLHGNGPTPFDRSTTSIQSLALGDRDFLAGFVAAGPITAEDIRLGTAGYSDKPHYYDGQRRKYGGHFRRISHGAFPPEYRTAISSQRSRNLCQFLVR